MTTTSSVSTSGSATYVTGTASGLDTDAIIDAAVAQKTARADTIDAKVTANKTKISSYQTLQTLLQAVSDSMSDLASSTYSAISTTTNAFDEAITTPTEDSVRRAMAIQLIINREWGLAKNENPNQGAFIIEELTELVEEAVLAEFEKIAERGGVLGAMETGYQRSKIQEESLHYEMLKHTGEHPIIGVNTFRNPHGEPVPEHIELARSTEEEKQSQLSRLADFHQRHAATAPATLQRLQQAVIDNHNVFAVLMDAVRCCSLGQITAALFEVGGQYRRSM